MFFTRQQDDAARRQQLLRARSTLLRRRLGDEAQVLERPLALVDEVRRGWLWLKAHPEALLAGALAFALVRPRRALRLASRAWAGWQLWRRLQGWHDRWMGAGEPAGHAAPGTRLPRRLPPR